jgi:hypothetical protein
VGKIRDGAKKYMDKHKLKFTSDIANFVHDSSISGATASAYKKHFRGFYQILALTGDYQAISLLSYHTVENYQYASTKHYLQWKTLNYMTTLMLETGPLTDILGVKISGKGGPKFSEKGEWKDPGNLYQCLSACSKSHKTRGKIGQ